MRSTGSRLRVLALLLGACEQPAPPARSAPVTDEPLVTIASPDSAGIAFDRIASLLVSPDAGIVLLSGQSRQFLVYDASNTLRHVFGLRGQGPGEFAFLAAHGLRGDTLWAYDPVQRRTSFFALDGTLLETRPFRVNIPGWRLRVELIAILADGSLLVAGEHSVSGLASGQSPTSVPLRRMTPAGGTLTDLGALDYAGIPYAAPNGGGTLVGFQPFLPVPGVAVAQDGSRFVVVSAAEEDPSPRVRVYRYDGRLLFDRSLPLAGDPLTDARLDSAFAVLGPQIATLASGIIRRPTTLPAVSAVLLATDGTVWLALDSPWLRRPVRRWARLQVEAGVIDTVYTPASLSVLRPERTTYWGFELDSMDVPVITRYPIPRRH